MSDRYCSTYCEHNAEGECDCQPCVWLRTTVGFIHADGCQAGELEELKAKLARIEALPDKWEDASRDWYYANRHTHEYGIMYVQGYEAGWDNAGELLRRELQREAGESNEPTGSDHQTEER